MIRTQTVVFFKKIHQYFLSYSRHILSKARPDEVNYFSFSLDGATRETNANSASTNN